MIPGMRADWLSYTADRKITFFGVLEQHYDECAKNWHKDETQDQYKQEYDTKILPNLPNQNEHGIDEYSKDDYVGVLNAINREYSEKHRVDYATTTMQHYRHLINTVVRVAFKHGLCKDVLFGTAFDLPTAQSESQLQENLKNELVLLRKSLTVQEEYAVAAQVLSDPAQSGQKMGLALMFCCGLRNAEACGIDFDDLKPLREGLEQQVLWVYKTSTDKIGSLQASGKTANADRLVPVPDVLVQLIRKRKAYLQTQLSPDIDVGKLPIACVETDITKRCTATHLTTAGREMFKAIAFSRKQLAYIDVELADDAFGDKGAIREKDPTAYLLRRNFATHLQILGLTAAEIQYVLGHDVEDITVTRNEFRNEEKLAEISKKMAYRPIVNTLQTAPALHPGENGNLSVQGEYNVRIPLSAGQLHATFTACEPCDALRLCADGTITGTGYTSTRQPVYQRTVNVRKAYREAYDRNGKITE